MGKSAGQQIYEARKAGALWSIACYVAGVALRDGLGAAREYADVNDLPWPPPVEQKKVGEFLGTRELREAIGRVFLPRGVTMTLTPEQEREGYRLRMKEFSWVRICRRIHCPYPEVARDCINDYAKRRGLPQPPKNVTQESLRKRARTRKNSPRIAYQLRLIEGLPWKEISARLGYKQYRYGQYCRRAAYQYATEEGLPWPVPAKEELPKVKNASRAYFYKGAGMTWEAVALLAGFSSYKAASDAAQRHSVKCGLPWPIEVAAP